MSASHVRSERRIGYWIGLVLAVAGFGTFAAVFATAVVELDQLGPEADTGSTLLGRMVFGMLLMVAGSMLMRMGPHEDDEEQEPRPADDEQDGRG
jgi:heme/copper-type cytochrome/quinol oxidase subunit 3